MENKEKKEYERPQIQLIILESDDVIRTSYWGPDIPA